jgi:hypothetical protein
LKVAFLIVQLNEPPLDLMYLADRPHELVADRISGNRVRANPKF